MVDWGSDDWGNDVDWTEVEQQASKRPKLQDNQREPDTSAVKQVRWMSQDMGIFLMFC